MKIVTVKRLIKRADSTHKFSDLGRSFFDHESNWHFALDALLFGALALSSAWPLIFAVEAVNQLLIWT